MAKTSVHAGDAVTGVAADRDDAPGGAIVGGGGTLDELGELELAGLLAAEPGDKELKLGRVALVPRTTFTCPALTELPACAVTPNSAAILAALAFAAAPDPYETSVADWMVVLATWPLVNPAVTSPAETLAASPPV